MRDMFLASSGLVWLLLGRADAQSSSPSSSGNSTSLTFTTVRNVPANNNNHVLASSSIASSISSSFPSSSSSPTSSGTPLTTSSSASTTPSSSQTSGSTSTTPPSDSCSSALASWSSKYSTTTTSVVTSYPARRYYVSTTYSISPAKPYTTLCDKVPRAHGSGTTQYITSFYSPDLSTQKVTVYPKNSQYPSGCSEKGSISSSSAPACPTKIFGGSDPFDPSPCHVNADFLRMAYWPVQVEGDLCGNRTTITDPVKTPRTATIWGTTVTSPAVLLSFPAVYATDPCGNEVGTSMPNVIVSQNPDQVRTACDNPHISGTVGVINFADFNSPVPASAYMCQFRCNPGYADQPGQTGLCSTIYDDFNPDVYPPSTLVSLQPAWASCSLDYYGFINDPPIALNAIATSASFSLPPGSRPATSTAATAPSNTGAASITTPPVPGSTATAPGPSATSSTAALPDSSPDQSGNNGGQSPPQPPTAGSSPGRPSGSRVQANQPANNGGQSSTQSQTAGSSLGQISGSQAQADPAVGNTPNVGSFILAGLGSDPSGSPSLLLVAPLTATASGPNVAIVNGQTVSWTASSVGQTVQAVNGHTYSSIAGGNFAPLTATATGQNVAVVNGQTISWTATAVGQTAQAVAGVVAPSGGAIQGVSGLSNASQPSTTVALSNVASRQGVATLGMLFAIALYCLLV